MRFITPAALAMCLTASPALAQDSSQRTIAVTGTATITAANDIAGFTTGIASRRASAGAALRAASTTMHRVIAALQAHGIAAKDIRTTRVSVRRVVRLHPRSVVFVATERASVTVRTVSDTGADIDAAIGAGATQLSGPSFRRSNTEALYRAALVKALDKARAKAQALATDSGATLGAVQSIDEAGADVQTFDSAASSGAAAPKEPTPVQPGRTAVTAQLTAVFAIQ